MAAATKTRPKTASAPKSNKALAPAVTDQKMFIGGRWVDAVSGKTFPTLNPATGEVICQVTND